MNNNGNPFEIGDLIVHVTYGVGKIEAIEPMPLSKNDIPCYRVSTKDSTFWIAIDEMDENQRVRPLASPERIQRALRTLRQPPRKMASNYKTRRKRIQKVTHDGDLKTDMILIRDLNELRFRKGLNDTEQQAYNTIVKRFLQEWALSKNIKMQEANRKLNKFLSESRAKAKNEQKVAA